MAGGRLKFEVGKEVKILLLDGHVDPKSYSIVSPIADRNGRVTVQSNSGREILVNQRRILYDVPLESAVVVCVANVFRAVCPHCEHVEQVDSDSTELKCPTHGVFNLWKGMKMAGTTTEKAKAKAEKPEAKVEAKQKPKTEPKPKVERPKVEPVVIDFAAVKKLPNCELWTMYSDFNHQMECKSHTLLFTGESPRKYCFNSYDGTTGKKGTPLFVDEFVGDKEVGGKKIWHNVKDLDKERELLKKKGYVQE